MQTSEESVAYALTREWLRAGREALGQKGEALAESGTRPEAGCDAARRRVAAWLNVCVGGAVGRCGLQEEDEENMGDVDLWALAEEGSALTVNGKWLQHLQVRAGVGARGWGDVRTAGVADRRARWYGMAAARCMSLIHTLTHIHTRTYKHVHAHTHTHTLSLRNVLLVLFNTRTHTRSHTRTHAHIQIRARAWKHTGPAAGR